jgi:hypothetical protein
MNTAELYRLCRQYGVPVSPWFDEWFRGFYRDEAEELDRRYGAVLIRNVVTGVVTTPAEDTSSAQPSPSPEAAR